MVGRTGDASPVSPRWLRPWLYGFKSVDYLHRHVPQRQLRMTVDSEEEINAQHRRKTMSLAAPRIDAVHSADQ